ncbi:adenine deaminase C-terminal domain-containing protein [Staphylospora marina]|uniref:adenine deaminase C-terminal domain-containing protein n=1 Tax=Staphylospora marina TaxID=2490858 RepID=UPI000F5BDB98|nr:adenine deaminase C-terminal domain-containing protein [Staphylospora marina]
MRGMLAREDQHVLLETAMGRRRPSLILRGGRVLNVFTGRLERKDVALAGKRIAWVGDLSAGGLMTDGDVPVLDVENRVLVPGYIEPHAHPFQLYNPVSLAEKAASLGTTTLIHDNMFFFNVLELDELRSMIDRLADSPVKHFWWARWDAQTLLTDGRERLYESGRVREMMSHPRVLQAGELTDWLPLLAGDPVMNEWVVESRALGLRVEGHAPGASFRTLSRLAAAGVTADHESISAEEVWRRLELGYWVTLRHSSIRPDLPVLLEGLLNEDHVPWHRIMMTTDGPTPLYFKEGFTDYLLKTAMESGLDPVTAYRLVTINPAVYFRLDDHLGAIAPGRVADINVLRDLTDPTPVHVIADGRIIAESGSMTERLDDSVLMLSPAKGKPEKIGFRPDDFSWPEGDVEDLPVMNLINPVITRLTMEPVSRAVSSSGDDLLMACLADRGGEWITQGYLRGLGRNVDGLASTYTGSGDLLVIGRDPRAMAEAANRAVKEGGIVWIQDDEEVFRLPLPLMGMMSPEPLDGLVRSLEPLVERLREHGHAFDDPIYTFLFLSSTHLPQVRLTQAGIFRVKDKTVLVPSRRRRR